jgi:hypothetical protein
MGPPFFVTVPLYCIYGINKNRLFHKVYEFTLDNPL